MISAALARTLQKKGGKPTFAAPWTNGRKAKIMFLAKSELAITTCIQLINTVLASIAVMSWIELICGIKAYIFQRQQFNNCQANVRSKKQVMYLISFRGLISMRNFVSTICQNFCLLFITCQAQRSALIESSHQQVS